MENFKDIVLSPEEEGLYQKAIAENPELTREQFKEIRSGAIKKVDIKINSDSDNIVMADQDYFDNKKER